MPDGAARLQAAFRERPHPIFMPYIMGGFPTVAASEGHLRAAAGHAGVIELGVPYSDPLADGPTIQAAGQTALRAGTRVEDVIELAEGLTGGPPIALMTYHNTLVARGVDRFLGRVRSAGIAGLIVPDLPVDEARPLREKARHEGIALIALAAPTSTDARLAEIGNDAAGFVYAVSVTGVTGGDVAIDEGLRHFLARLGAAVSVPVAVGFGIRTPAQAAAVGAVADGVVVASQIIRLIQDATDDASGAVGAYCAEVAEALRSVSRPDRESLAG